MQIMLLKQGQCKRDILQFLFCQELKWCSSGSSGRVKPVADPDLTSSTHALDMGYGAFSAQSTPQVNWCLER
jgi:hypothetical protein